VTGARPGFGGPGDPGAIVHRPVLLVETLRLLVPPADDCLMVDATLGQGGHAQAFLEQYPRLALVGIDADEAILETARSRLAAYAERIELVRGWFADVLEGWGDRRRPHLVLFDLGISRFHYEASGRGFSFERGEPLDMRLDPSAGASAADIVNGASAAELADILRRYGEEPDARRIAARIVSARAEAPIDSARRLAEVIRGAVASTRRHGRLHPATRSFQALRIAVNGELGQLERGLAAAFALLEPRGRIAVISFHSLEDRIAKRFFAARLGRCTCPPDLPICVCGGKRELTLLAPKPIRPGEEETARNPAARSAKLRAAEKAAA
jgi:16S rRNA (cytosine1402-N4)-methyltransferase